MNFEALNGLVKSLVSSYKCVDCGEKVTTNDLNVKELDGNTVTLEAVCPKCDKKSLIKSEVMSVDLKKLNLTQEQISLIKKGVQKNNDLKIGNIKSKISDIEIVELNKDLKKEQISVSDLFSQRED